MHSLFPYAINVPICVSGFMSMYALHKSRHVRLSLGSIITNNCVICAYSALLDNVKLFSKIVTLFYSPASIIGTLGLHILIILGLNL